jgi:hypothetical protein
MVDEGVSDAGVEAVEESDDGPRVTVRAVAIAGAVLALVAVVAMHVALPAVAATEAVPDGHFPGPCWACHIVSG